ncbi:hypothetical protein V2W30_22590 [Streptomyces sp. Q6]|uniref:Uncharacterized protein n=1 Tax=Streptomyces citrinus TaxID=3118173 RepID=A0ACD5AF24_9ACTN
MTITIRLVGGPDDGRTMTIMDNEPPPLYLIPQPPPLTDLWADPLAPPAPIPVAQYELMHENGWPRREDDGTYLYGHRPTPAAPGARHALEESRRAAQTAEEQRTAELDATWSEIRKERPQYPEDWRELGRP